MQGSTHSTDHVIQDILHLLWGHFGLLAKAWAPNQDLAGLSPPKDQVSGHFSPELCSPVYPGVDSTLPTRMRKCFTASFGRDVKLFPGHG